MISNPDGHAGLDRGFFLSKTGNCKTFDDAADGYCRGEAIATVIIKRLEDAIFDNDPILALIDGITTNHSGETDSITRPYAPAQKAVFEKLLVGFTAFILQNSQCSSYLALRIPLCIFNMATLGQPRRASLHLQKGWYC